MLDRCAGKAGARDAAIGRLPRAGDLDTHGLEISHDALAQLLAVDPVLWRKEVAEVRDYLSTYGPRLPQALLHELATTEQGLG
jgi:phosphoenolpyruvate carboxykinase (GTP)